MMAPTDRDRDDRMGEHSAARLGNGLLHEPVSRETTAVPRQRAAEIGDHTRIARRSQASVFDLLEISSQLIESMSIVSQQVGFNEHFRDRTSAIVR
jgi:hypothetical protein